MPITITFPSIPAADPAPDTATLLARHRAELAYHLLRGAVQAYRPPVVPGQAYEEPDWDLYADLLEKMDTVGLLLPNATVAGLSPDGGALALTTDEAAIVTAAWSAYRRAHCQPSQAREVRWLNTALGL